MLIHPDTHRSGSSGALANLGCFLHPKEQGPSLEKHGEPNMVTSSLSRPDSPFKVTEEKNSFCSPPGGSRLGGGAEAADSQKEDGRCLRPNVCPPEFIC